MTTTYTTNLLEAVHRRNLPRVKALLLRGADANTADAQGVTPLIVACERGHVEMVDALLEAKASTKSATHDTQSTCLHFAAKSHSPEVVRRLLQVDPSIQERSTIPGDTALMLACLSADDTKETAATLAALLQVCDDAALPPSSKFTLGPDDFRLRACNRHGHTALHCATFASSPTAVRMLLEAGADCTIGDKAGRTAFDVAMNLAGKKTPVREAGRSGSAPATKCLNLLKERWHELEQEARDKELRLLGEIDAAGSGARRSVRKKKKKQPHLHQESSEVSPRDRARGRASTAQPYDTQEEGGAGRVAHDARNPGPANSHAQLSSALPTAAISQESSHVSPSRVTRDGRAGNGGGTSSGKRDSSDSEGETDDEAGSHPSSDADAASRGELGDGSEADVEAVASAPARAHPEGVDVVSTARVHEAGSGSDVVLEGVTEAAEAAETQSLQSHQRAADNDMGNQLLLERFMEDHDSGGGRGGSSGSWSIVAPKARRKRTGNAAPSAPGVVRVGSPLPGATRNMRPRGHGGSRGAPSASRHGDFPSLPSKVATRRDTRIKGVRVGTGLGPRPQPTVRMIVSTTVKGVAGLPRAGQSTFAQPVDANSGAAVVLPTQKPSSQGSTSAPHIGTPALASGGLPVESNGAQEEVVRGEGSESASRLEVAQDVPAAAPGSAPMLRAKRQLNVNAHAWTPGVAQRSGQPTGATLQQEQQEQLHHSIQQPVQQPMEAMQQHTLQHAPLPPPLHQMQMPMHMPHAQGIPAVATTAGPPALSIPFPVMPVGPGNMPLAHVPPPGAWTHPEGRYDALQPICGMVTHGSGVEYNDQSLSTSNGNAATQASTDVVQAPPLPALPANTAPVPNERGGVVNAMLQVPSGDAQGSLTQSSHLHLRSDDSRAQQLLEASSPEAAALALKAEYLVWTVEAMSTGLSMAQLDTVKAFLLHQAARVDEAKLEQVRVQERSKNEEKTNIMQQLQKTQNVPDTSSSSLVARGIDQPASDASTESALAVEEGVVSATTEDVNKTTSAQSPSTDVASMEKDWPRPAVSSRKGVDEVEKGEAQVM